MLDTIKHPVEMTTIVAGGEDAAGKKTTLNGTLVRKKINLFVLLLFVFRTVYGQASRIEYSTQYSPQFGCCSGYQQVDMSCQRKSAEKFK